MISVTAIPLIFGVLVLAQDPDPSVTNQDIPSSLTDTDSFPSTTPTDSPTPSDPFPTVSDTFDPSLSSTSSTPTPTDSFTSNSSGGDSSSTSQSLDTFTPASTPSPSSSQSTRPSASPKSHTGAVAGGVVGGFVALGVIAGLFILLLRRRNGNRRLSSPGGGGFPPSPRLKSPWLGGMPRAKRLGSLGGESTFDRSLDGHSGAGQIGAQSDDTHGFVGGYTTTTGAAGLRRHISSGSRRSNNGVDPYTNPRSSYDLNVFSGGTGTSGSVANRTGSQQSIRTDPFASDPSIPAVGVDSPSTLARTPSTGNRLARKPAPKYEPNSEISTNTSPRNSSKPPVSGVPISETPTRPRTYSNSSSLRAMAAVASTGGLTSQLPVLQHRGSSGTLGGAFKFAGEKEGPVHYLMPDMPADQ